MKKHFLILLTGLICHSTLGQISDTITNNETGQKSILISDVAIEPFYFESNSVNYSVDKKIQGIVSAFKLYGFEEILLTGHCTTDELSNNLGISMKRAEIIKKLLVDNGFPSDKIKLEDLKNTQPIEINKVDSKENRRVQLIIL